MIIVGYILFAMLLLRFFVVLANFVSRPYLPVSNPDGNKAKLSVLIPARNEESNIANVLNDLLQADYDNIEVIVCNDQSTDSTESILKEYSTKLENMRYFNNEALPKGWIGKNYACHKLSGEARGDYLMFLDADVRIGKGFIKHALAYMQNSDKKLLSIFPEQIIESAGEKRTVPIMTWILLSFLPLALVRWRWFPSLSAANGQMMLFEAASYKRNRWHERFHAVNVEDIVIARNMKREKLPIAVLLGKKDILCRMYTSYNEAIRGFSLNIHQYFNGSRFWMLFFWLMLVFRLPYFLLIQQYLLFCLSILMLTIMRLMHARLSQRPVSESFRYYPNQLWSLSMIIHRNLKNAGSGKIEWKGRVYRAKD